MADGSPHVRIEDAFDFRAPDYAAVYRARAERLARIRANPAILEALRLHYKWNPDDFINDFGCTFEVRNPERGLPALVPFILFPKQREWVRKVMECWRNGKPLITEKSRDCGLSWLSVALGCTLCLFWEGLNIGYGSRKEEYVDKIGVPKALFERGRQFLRYLPLEFTSRPGANAPEWTSAHMRIMFGATGSTMTGEAGDNIGRGDRASIYFTDEEAFLERPALVEASLSQTTNCRVSISTPNGMANPFAQKRWGGKIEVFTFHWRDDPRKDEKWYQKQCDELDPVTLAQEVDLDYSASVEGVIIPSAWVQSAIDAHVKLHIDVTGETRAALDVADEGIDTNALAAGKGILLNHLVEWSGKGADIFATTQKAFMICDDIGARELQYDADGLGAGVRGDARVINESRPDRRIATFAFRGSGAVERAESQDVKGRINKDFFSNAKAQSWWALRLRFERTHRAVQEVLAGGQPKFDPDDLISIDSRLPTLGKLQQELSQPTYSINITGKIVVDKKPDGTKSPNLADAVMIRYSGARRTMRISQEALNRA